MKNDIYDSMLAAYDMTTEQQRRNAIFPDFVTLKHIIL